MQGEGAWLSYSGPTFKKKNCGIYFLKKIKIVILIVTRGKIVITIESKAFFREKKL